MRINIHGRNVTVTDSIKNYIEEKIGKLDKYFTTPEEVTANVVIRVRGKDQIIEVTIPRNKITLRGEERHSDLYAAIDLVSDKIERQIRKNKTRMKKKINKEYIEDLNIEFESIEEEKEESIVRRKEITMKPMSEEEAILQMNLLGHEFFAFKNTDTNSFCVLYKRKDGEYGILETK